MGVENEWNYMAEAFRGMKIKTLQVLFILILSLSYSSAQVGPNTVYIGTVYSDTSLWPDTLNGYNGSILSSHHTIEIRFYYFPTHLSTGKYIYLYYDSCWKIRLDLMSSGTGMVDWIIPLGEQGDSIFALLVANNIFTLPGMREVTTDSVYFNLKTGNFEEDGSFIMDGICYGIEFKIGEKFRGYGFCNPDFYSGHFTGDAMLGNYSEIVRIFESLPKEEK